MVWKRITCADESSSARLITVPYNLSGQFDAIP